ncbi:hypothetical protein DFP72DRAFT_838527 [Ephemerocybe angulata]|uniref:Uncharacterized protein n=1 Tax=Ephemerocybe angulata TaxID=980116 RepID=A0A8H6IJY5_9AGAR|nr:hypothetical protein DFP72DRAFT_838527 [Tulosesus angulatus]
MFNQRVNGRGTARCWPSSKYVVFRPGDGILWNTTSFDTSRMQGLDEERTTLDVGGEREDDADESEEDGEGAIFTARMIPCAGGDDDRGDLDLADPAALSTRGCRSNLTDLRTRFSEAKLFDNTGRVPVPFEELDAPVPAGVRDEPGEAWTNRRRVVLAASPERWWLEGANAPQASSDVSVSIPGSAFGREVRMAVGARLTLYAELAALDDVEHIESVRARGFHLPCMCDGHLFEGFVGVHTSVSPAWKDRGRGIEMDIVPFKLRWDGEDDIDNDSCGSASRSKEDEGYYGRVTVYHSMHHHVRSKVGFESDYNIRFVARHLYPPESSVAEGIFRATRTFVSLASGRSSAANPRPSKHRRDENRAGGPGCRALLGSARTFVDPILPSAAFSPLDLHHGLLEPRGSYFYVLWHCCFILIEGESMLELGSPEDGDDWSPRLLRYPSSPDRR